MNALVLLVLLSQAPAAGSDPGRAGTPGTVALGRLEGANAFVVDLYVDLDALLLGGSSAMPAAQRLAAMEALRSAGRVAETTAIDRLTETFRRRIRVRFDGVASELAIEYPERRATKDGELATLGELAGEGLVYGRRRSGGHSRGGRAPLALAARRHRGQEEKDDGRRGVSERP